MSNGDIAAVIINWSMLERGRFSFKLSDIGINGTAIARDLYEHKDLGKFSDKFHVEEIAAYGCVALRFRSLKETSNQGFLGIN